jgi:hypothetical protein
MNLLSWDSKFPKINRTVRTTIKCFFRIVFFSFYIITSIMVTILIGLLNVAEELIFFPVYTFIFIIIQSLKTKYVVIFGYVNIRDIWSCFISCSSTSFALFFDFGRSGISFQFQTFSSVDEIPMRIISIVILI